ncbi:MAG TPA: hypothetical protein ENN30_02620 [Candidatus Woesearchaeota archaeon]|nr:hypothetical protein [Candidatus Woesearchaeota archaeon]
MAEDQTLVDYIQSGRHNLAARRAEELGDFPRAVGLYAMAGEFRHAIQLADQTGDNKRAESLTDTVKSLIDENVGNRNYCRAGLLALELGDFENAERYLGLSLAMDTRVIIENLKK